MPGLLPEFRQHRANRVELAQNVSSDEAATPSTRRAPGGTRSRPALRQRADLRRERRHHHDVRGRGRRRGRGTSAARRPDHRRGESPRRRAVDGRGQLPVDPIASERARVSGPARGGSLSSTPRSGNLLAFVLAGAVPFVPYTIPGLPLNRFAVSMVLTLLAMFGVGASRALIANVRWLKAGLEMLGLGAIVAALAYGSGALVAAIVGRA